MLRQRETLSSDQAKDSRLHDLLGFGLAVLLAVLLLGVWGIDIRAIGSLFGPDTPAREEALEALGQVADQLASTYLLFSLAFAVALCYGLVDLSVWSAGALGGVVAATLINAGLSAWASLTVGTMAGGLMGAVNGLFVVRTRIPSFIVTGLAGSVVMGGMLLCLPGRSIEVAPSTFEGWHLVADVTVDVGESTPADQPGQTNGPPDRITVRRVWAPLGVTRKLIVAAIYAAVVVALLQVAAAGARGVRWPARRRTFVVLCVSGLLAAAGGGLWLIDYGQAPVPTRPIGDLRVVAAALLAGAAFHIGVRRVPLAAVGLLVGLLAATIWRQQVWVFPAFGYDTQTAGLIVMVLVAHAGLSCATAEGPGGRVVRAIWPILTCAGLAVAAISASFEGSSLRLGLLAAGLAVWSAGAAGLGLWRAAHWLIGRRR